MTPPEPNYPATTNPGYPNETETQEEDLKSNLLKDNRSNKKSKLRQFWRWKNLKKRTGTMDISITNRRQEMKERILDVEDMIGETNISVKENAKSKKLHDTKHPENLRYYEEKKKTKNNRNRKRRR